MKSLSRRTLLRGSLLGVPVGVGLPVLDAMLDGRGEALAATGDPLPKRFGVWFFGGGVIRSDVFFPTTPGRSWQPTELLQPLVPVRDYLTLVRGCNMPQVNPGGHHGHSRYALSNSYLTTAAAGFPGTSNAPTIDQIAAEAWAGTARFDSLQLGVTSNGCIGSSISWKAGYRTLRADVDPRSVFARLFTGDAPRAPGTPTNLDAIQALQRSMLDGTMASTRQIAARVGARDRQRLEAHLEGLRAIERRLQVAPPATRACGQPSAPTVGPMASKNRGDIEAVNRVMSDLTAVALACDLTRVVSFMFTGPQDETIYYQVGENEGYHNSGHNATWYATNGKKVVLFIMKQLAYLADKLKATTEGAGNLLDRTLLFATSEFQNAAAHSTNDHPFILIGRAGGSLAGGTYVRASGGPSLGTAMLAALRAVGVSPKGVGDPNGDTKSRAAYATEPLPGILAGT